MSQTAQRSGSRGSGGVVANATLIVGSGSPKQGCESKVPQVWQETLNYTQRLQESGQIDGFQPIILEPHGDNAHESLVLLFGDKDKLNQIRSSPDFQRMYNRMKYVNNGVDIMGGFVGDEFDRQVTILAQTGSDLTP